MMNFGYGYGSLSGISMIFMILWWAFIIVGIISLLKWLEHGGHRGHAHNHGQSAMEILQERYAKGEISKKEFAEKKKDLQS